MRSLIQPPGSLEEDGRKQLEKNRGGKKFDFLTKGDKHVSGWRPAKRLENGFLAADLAWRWAGGKGERWAGSGTVWEGPLRLLPRSCRLKVAVPEYRGVIKAAPQEAGGGDCLNYVGGDRLVE